MRRGRLMHMRRGRLMHNNMGAGDADEMGAGETAASHARRLTTELADAPIRRFD